MSDLARIGVDAAPRLAENGSLRSLPNVCKKVLVEWNENMNTLIFSLKLRDAVVAGRQ